MQNIAKIETSGYSEIMTKKQNNEEYTALIYFHGIGQPNRYEEISRFSDGLSNYAMSSDPGSIGELRKFRSNSEPMRGNEKETITYLSFKRFVEYKKEWKKRPQTYRLYEGFWSPTTAGGMSAWAVMLWFFLNVYRVFMLPFRSWREGRRLKLISLFKLSESLDTPKEKSFCAELADHYRHFDKRDARRHFPAGKLAEFREVIAGKYSPKQLKFANTIIDRWRLLYRWDVFKIIIQYMLVSIMPIAFLAIGFLGSKYFYTRIDSVLALIFPLLIVVLGGLLLRFYRIYVADIFFWVNSQEKNSAFRKKVAILDESIALLRHVLSDEKCIKIVVVGHSLGSSIAFESLIELGKRPDLRVQRKCTCDVDTEDSRMLDLSKLSCFVTLGSPIDKIASIFEVARTDYHRYNDFVDYTKGNVTHSPFTLDGKKNIEWINFWDSSDPISSPVYSKQYKVRDIGEITNEEVCTSHARSPLKRHSAYLENIAVMKKIFKVFILKG